MGLKFSDNATTTLSVGLAPGDTVINVVTSTGALFPTVTGAPGTPDYFILTLEDNLGNREFVRVDHHGAGSDIFGNVSYPCTRAYYGSSARTWNVGDLCDLRWNAGLADQIAAEAAAATATASAFDPLRTTIALS
jgi:hypothetical protein